MSKQILVAFDGTGMNAKSGTNVHNLSKRAAAAGATVIYRTGLGSKKHLSLIHI